MVTFIVVTTYILNLVALAAFGWCVGSIGKDIWKGRNDTE